MLEAVKVAHTGLGVEASRTCMDKVATSLIPQFDLIQEQSVV